MVLELVALGVGYAEIAESCGTSRGTIHDIGTGRTVEPKYGLGVTMLDMLKKARRRATRLAA